MHKLRVNDAEIYCESHGAGAPVVLVPGFGTGMWIWYKQIPALAEKFRVIAFDPRGVAKSNDESDAPLTMRLLADDLAGLLESLKIERAHIVGASFGGFIAQEFALAYPQMLDKLVLCCTSYGGAGHVPPTAETLAALASTKGLNTEERVRENLLLAFSPRFVAEHKEEIERVIKLRAENFVPEQVYLRQLQAAMMFDARQRASEIKAPTLVLTGDEDIIVPMQNSMNLAATLPHAQLKIIKGGSHTFFIEQADKFNVAVAEFLSDKEC
jgi:pimeloyl-ACP methyl ester carboxylesterase